MLGHVHDGTGDVCEATVLEEALLQSDAVAGIVVGWVGWNYFGVEHARFYLADNWQLIDE
jgi:hypothetical protein